MAYCRLQLKRRDTDIIPKCAKWFQIGFTGWKFGDPQKGKSNKGKSKPWIYPFWIYSFTIQGYSQDMQNTKRRRAPRPARPRRRSRFVTPKFEFILFGFTFLRVPKNWTDVQELSMRVHLGSQTLRLQNKRLSVFHESTLWEATGATPNLGKT